MLVGLIYYHEAWRRRAITGSVKLRRLSARLTLSVSPQGRISSSA